MRVLITGASKGIGRTLADRLAAEGHHPIGLARTAPPDFPGDFHVADLADVDATAAALDEIVAAGAVDGLVNNVGTAKLAPLGSVDLDDVARTYDLNFRTAVQVTQAVLPGMLAAGRGRIVNVTSLVTLGTPHRTSYGGSKAALEAATGIWAGELAARGITVNAVAPGPTETELFRKGTPAGSEREAWFLDQLPVGRLGRPAEIAHAICFLLSEDAGFITGQVLRVDGGASIAAA
ncbi:SDR family oxidoreductase [Amycolatopsis sp. FDAARGOS 1241]|uniref:SDR family oxidoreductase n=1 Tax=Amycolatopsis sp. FDAARGOS 1241 TaxID=2778070 RepID=UPI0019521BBB|nr:SDR family oxidoreductase [Amycolatopsis sp. FDAARGOS 1241]QRP47687.1 SDR family oxidoreductase [Amycolatopsis sp. FDAARGOS 1241]